MTLTHSLSLLMLSDEVNDCLVDMLYYVTHHDSEYTTEVRNLLVVMAQVSITFGQDPITVSELTDAQLQQRAEKLLVDLLTEDLEKLSRKPPATSVKQIVCSYLKRCLDYAQRYPNIYSGELVTQMLTKMTNLAIPKQPDEVV